MISEDIILQIWALSLLGNFSNTEICSKFKHLKHEELPSLLEIRIPAELERLVTQELNACLSKDIKILTLWHENYPSSLLNLHDPPLILFAKGNLEPKDSIGIVGSRNCSSYGKKYSKHFASLLAKRGLSVVSGLASGIDSAAHLGAIESGFYPGVAVLGCGLNVIYPAHNKSLYQSLLESGGAVISEFGLNAKPRNYYFPRRNRIISGLSKAVIVIEANLRSGSLITARTANEQGRDVLALPGPIDSDVSLGSNKLISEGAKIICSNQDLIDYLEEQGLGKCFSEEEITTSEMISELKVNSHTVESLSEKLNQPMHEIYANLLTLELKGLLSIGINGDIELSA